ncbi:MAG: hypothetical protein ACF8LK_05940 [Phycisphaerales bacterium JB041]
MTRLRTLLHAALLVGLVTVGARAQVSGADGAAQDEPDPLRDLPEWVAARLEALEPGDAEPYFLLGEEIVDLAPTKTGETLARELFALAFELDRRDGTPTWIAPSSCIALASIARLESDERWLRAIANRTDPRYAPAPWRLAGTDARGVSSAAFAAAETVGETRAGNGIQARALLEKPGVRELLLRYGRMLGFSASTGAAWQIELWAGDWPCRECGNERVVFRPNTEPPSYRECYTCRGNPGPKLSTPEIVAQLRFESRLLQGISRSWGAQLAIDLAAPLREPVPDELAAVLGVDAGRPYWRGGWVSRPGDRAAGPTVEPEPDEASGS